LTPPAETSWKNLSGLFPFVYTQHDFHCYGFYELAYAIFAVGAVFVLKLTPPIDVATSVYSSRIVRKTKLVYSLD